MLPLNTARLELRPYRPSDALPFFQLLDENRQRLQPAFPSRVAAVQTLADAQQVLDAFMDDWRSGQLYVFGMWEQATARYIGDISLKPNWAAKVTAEISYYLDAGAEGKGYAREAVRGTLAFGFNTVRADRLLIRCRANNPRSCAVAESVGFQLLPPRHRAWTMRPLRTDVIQYFLFKREDMPASLA
ncbi:GNAT family N-acetyltransferase [Hymenobacter sp. DG25A]|uniref:GNAT family N-acetyltransferase n=1 Tax=Hymenobacter sp. DG25A TaxID=1385663 RepID=UPI0006C84DF7|nr:GNAT family N-acetyltransferase [Hymenobacter sp. DG25A]